MKFLIYTARLHKAKLHILNVKEATELTEGQKANQELVRTCLDSIDHAFEQVDGQFRNDALQDYVADKHIGLLALVNRKHSFLERLLVKPTVDSIGYHTQIPFLVLPGISEESINMNRS